MCQFNFPEAYARIQEATGCRTQTELAAYLGIRQSSISDAKRRGSIPADWLLILLRRKGFNPDWMISGQGARFLIPCGCAANASADSSQYA